MKNSIYYKHIVCEINYKLAINVDADHYDPAIYEVVFTSAVTNPHYLRPGYRILGHRIPEHHRIPGYWNHSVIECLFPL